MGKVQNYVMLMIGLALILSFAGIPVAGVSNLLSKLGLVEGSITSESSFVTTITTILLGVAGAGIIIGFFTRSNPENYIVLGALTSLTIFGTLGFAIINAAYGYANWIGNLTLLIFGPLTIDFFISLLDWFRGND